MDAIKNFLRPTRVTGGILLVYFVMTAIQLTVPLFDTVIPDIIMAALFWIAFIVNVPFFILLWPIDIFATTIVKLIPGALDAIIIVYLIHIVAIYIFASLISKIWYLIEKRRQLTNLSTNQPTN